MPHKITLMKNPSTSPQIHDSCPFLFHHYRFFLSINMFMEKSRCSHKQFRLACSDMASWFQPEVNMMLDILDSQTTVPHEEPKRSKLPKRRGSLDSELGMSRLEIHQENTTPVVGIQHKIHVPCFDPFIVAIYPPVLCFHIFSGKLRLLMIYPLTYPLYTITHTYTHTYIYI